MERLIRILILTLVLGANPILAAKPTLLKCLIDGESFEYSPERMEVVSFFDRSIRLDNDKYHTIRFSFDRPILINKSGYISLLSDDQKITEHFLTHDYAPGVAMQDIYITLDNVATFEIDKSYHIVIPSGLLCDSENPDDTNDEIILNLCLGKDFKCRISPTPLSENLDDEDFINYEAFGVIKIASEMYGEVDSNRKVLLLRQGIPVREFDLPTTPLYLTDEFYFTGIEIYRGLVHTGVLYCEKGVKYEAVLPAGAFHSVAFPEIGNAEYRYEFYGTSDRDFPPLTCVGTYPENDARVNMLSEVSFSYDRPVRSTGVASVQLYADGDPEPVAEATIVIDDNDGKALANANFNGISLDENRGYRIVLPENALSSSTGDIALNERTEICLNGSTYVGMEQHDAIKVESRDGTVTVSNAPEGTALLVVTPDGKVISSAKAGNEPLTIEGLSNGIYIVKAGSFVRSILVK